MLCITTSKRVFRTPFAGQNHFFDAKTTCSVNFYFKMLKNNAKNSNKSVKKRVYKPSFVSLSFIYVTTIIVYPFHPLSTHVMKVSKYIFVQTAVTGWALKVGVNK